MTREEAKKLLPIVQAIAEEKTLQTNVCGEWVDLEFGVTIDIPDSYRIKPETKYRPFKNTDECWNEMQKHEPLGWVKKINGGYKQIMAIHIDMFNKHCADFVGQTGTTCFELEYIYKNYTFADGTPFGVKEE